MIAVAWAIHTVVTLGLTSLPIVQDSTPPTWKATCSPAAAISGLSFHSKSGDVTEDDMEIRIIWKDGTTTLARIHPRWFKPTRFTSNLESRCSGMAAFQVSGGRLLLWIRYDGRPGFDHLAVLLVDPTTKAVLDSLPDLGELYGNGSAVVLSRPGHFETLLVREWLLDRIGGGEYGRPDWKILTISGRTLRAQWSR